MNAYLSLVTVFVSGLFGLAVAIVSSLLANRKDAKERKRRTAQDHYEELKTVYSGSLASLEKCFRSVIGPAVFPALEEELAINNARLQLVASDEIVEQSKTVSELIYAWSAEYKQGKPKPFGDTGAVVISSTDTPHRKEAAELYPKTMNACMELANLMRNHLAEVRDQAGVS